MIKKGNQVLGFEGWVGGGMEKSNYYIDTLHPTNARGNIFYTRTEFARKIVTDKNLPPITI